MFLHFLNVVPSGTTVGPAGPTAKGTVSGILHFTPPPASTLPQTGEQQTLQVTATLSNGTSVVINGSNFSDGGNTDLTLSKNDPAPYNPSTGSATFNPGGGGNGPFGFGIQYWNSSPGAVPPVNTFPPLVEQLAWNSDDGSSGGAAAMSNAEIGSTPLEGYLFFTIQLPLDLPTGTVVSIQASITNGTGTPLVVPALVYTVDDTAATSSVTPLPPTSSSAFTVSWSGQDNSGGAGIAGYDVFVSDNGGPFSIWQADTPNTSAIYTGQIGHTYAFYSRAIDGVGNVEPTHATADAETTISSPPVVKLNAPSANYTTTWNHGSPVAIASTGNALITDSESVNLTSMTVTLSTHQPGDILSAAPTGSISVAAYNPTTGVLLLSGSDTLANYLVVLKSVTFNNTTGGPAIAAETVSVVANDGTQNSAAALSTINVNVAPVVLLNSPAANNATTFTNASPVAIGNAGHVSVTDGETGNLVSLMASLASPQPGDMLTDGTANGSVIAGTSITSSYNAGTGVLTLSGSDTLAHYQQVLGTVKYNNTTGSPNIAAETVNVVANDGFNTSTAAVATINISVTTTPSSVSAVKLFYDNSKFNKFVEGVGAGTNDDKAIDTSKTAYLPGAGTANFSNISSFTDGINGIMVDLAAGGIHGNLNASDFTFRVGLNNTPSKWASAPAPSTIAVRTGSPTAGNDRVELIWTDGSITDEWLEVTVHADPNTGLSAPYTFFYGSVIANSGTGDTGALAITSSTDENAARNHSGSATVTNVFDYNKDGFVNSSDENAARNNGATVKFIKVAANTPLAPDASAAVAPDLTVPPSTTVAPETTGDTGIASGMTALLNSLKTGTLPPLRLDLLPSELKNVNLNSSVAAAIFEALAIADTKLTKSILVEADKVADELGLDDTLLDSILVDLGLE